MGAFLGCLIIAVLLFIGIHDVVNALDRINASLQANNKPDDSENNEALGDS